MKLVQMGTGRGFAQVYNWTKDEVWVFTGRPPGLAWSFVPPRTLMSTKKEGPGAFSGRFHLIRGGLDLDTRTRGVYVLYDRREAYRGPGARVPRPRVRRALRPGYDRAKYREGIGVYVASYDHFPLAPTEEQTELRWILPEGFTPDRGVYDLMVPGYAYDLYYGGGFVRIARSTTIWYVYDVVLRNRTETSGLGQTYTFPDEGTARVVAMQLAIEHMERKR